MTIPSDTAATPLSPRSERRLAAAILALFIALGVTYSVTAPLMEAPDESRHYPFAKHLADGHGLPVQDPGNPGPWEQEGSQPPLYYALAAAMTHWIDTDDVDAVLWLNPHARIGLPLAVNNKNLIVHTERERWPWQGTVLAVRLIRLFSVSLGAGTVLCTRALARRLLPRRPDLALAAMALNAFLPTFVFISGSVNNDNLVTLLASLVLVALVAFVQQGATAPRLLGVGALIGLACLTKLSGLALIPLAGLALVLRGALEAGLIGGEGRIIRRGSAPALRGARVALLRRAALVLAPVVLLAGWWYLRNATLYGDPLGLRPMLDIVGRRSTLPAGRKVLSEFQGLRISFWALFGAVNVLLRPTWLYTLFDGASALAAVGLAMGAWRARGRLLDGRWPAVVLPVVWVLAVSVALVRWTSMTMASQGRLLYSAISAICLLFVLGLAAWAPLTGGGRRARNLGLALLGLLLAVCATAPFVAIAPAYRRPPIITAADVPAEASPVNATFGGMMRLLAYEVHTTEVRPGDEVEVALYWQALRPMAEDYSLAIHLFGRDREPLGQTDSYPGGGSYPTRLWSPDEVMRDLYRVPVRASARGPVAARIEVGLYRLATYETLPAVDGAGREVNPVSLGRVKVAGQGAAATTPARPLSANLDGRVHLAGYDLSAEAARPGEEIEVTLHWRVTGRLEEDLTVFLQLLDADGAIVGQGDGPPMAGDYPTSLWAPNEALQDQHRLRVREDAPAGTCRIIVGLYNLATGQRLPVVDAAGRPVADHVELATVRLVAE